MLWQYHKKIRGKLGGGGGGTSARGGGGGGGGISPLPPPPPPVSIPGRAPKRVLLFDGETSTRKSPRLTPQKNEKLFFLWI